MCVCVCVCVCVCDLIAALLPSVDTWLQLQQTLSSTVRLFKAWWCNITSLNIRAARTPAGFVEYEHVLIAIHLYSWLISFHSLLHYALTAPPVVTTILPWANSACWLKLMDCRAPHCCGHITDWKTHRGRGKEHESLKGIFQTYIYKWKLFLTLVEGCCTSLSPMRQIVICEYGRYKHNCSSGYNVFLCGNCDSQRNIH